MDILCAEATFSTQEFARLCDVSYRVADYWARTGTLRPSVADARGSGSARRYARLDVAIGQVLGRLAGLGAKAAVLAEVAATLRTVAAPWSGYLLVTAGRVLYGPSLVDLDVDVEAVTAGWLVRLDGVDDVVDLTAA